METNTNPFSPIAFKSEPAPVPETHDGKCDQQTRSWGRVFDCRRAADRIYLNADNAGFMVMCRRHFADLQYHAPEFLQSGQVIEYNETNIKAVIERWNKYGNSKPLEPLVEYKTPPPAFKPIKKTESENVTIIERDGKTYQLVWNAKAEAKITDLGSDSDAGKLYENFHRGSYPWHYSLEGLHAGDPIEILVVNARPEYDEDGSGVDYDAVVFADDFAPLDDDIWEMYADEMRDILKQDLC